MCAHATPTPQYTMMYRQSHQINEIHMIVFQLHYLGYSLSCDFIQIYSNHLFYHLKKKTLAPLPYFIPLGKSPSVESGMKDFFFR